jgi:hypothetical protein
MKRFDILRSPHVSLKFRDQFTLKFRTHQRWMMQSTDKTVRCLDEAGPAAGVDVEMCSDKTASHCTSNGFRSWVEVTLLEKLVIYSALLALYAIQQGLLTVFHVKKHWPS